ncbi:hypothetical protein AB8A17_20125, partial [Mycobacterium tuberculosis]
VTCALPHWLLGNGANCLNPPNNGIEGYKVRPPVAGGEIIPISPTRRCEMHTMSSAEYRGL